MKKLSTKYLHESTGITFEILFENGKKHIKVLNNRNGREFVFNTSKPETLIKVSRALLEIGTFCDTLRIDSYNLAPLAFDYNTIVDAPPKATDPHSTATYTNDDLERASYTSGKRKANNDEIMIWDKD